jgi:hypothetical protein
VKEGDWIVSSIAGGGYRSSRRRPAASWRSRAWADSTTGTFALREVEIEADKTIELRLEVRSAVKISDPIASTPNQNDHFRLPSTSKSAAR